MSIILRNVNRKHFLLKLVRQIAVAVFALGFLFVLVLFLLFPGFNSLRGSLDRQRQLGRPGTLDVRFAHRQPGEREPAPSCFARHRDAFRSAARKFQTPANV
jgi:hypothetical protein